MSGIDAQVLVVVNEALLAGAISRAMSDAGYTPHWAANGQGALDMVAHQPYAALIVELALPDLLGLHLVRCLRAAGHCVPVVLLGGRMIPELVSGVQDPSVVALAKPFVIADLVSRLRSLIGRTDRPRSETPHPQQRTRGRLVYGRLEVDTATRAVSCEGRSVTLTDREFAVLDCLIRRPEEVVSRSELAKAVWGSEHNTRSNVLEVYINFLRRKLDRGFERKLLHTVRGAGYVLRAESQ
jgi:DNA-binding response OmpR family regulator